jgi:predicted PurR-regulated permease PerM
LSIGVITGILEIVPFIGSFTGAGLAMVTAATSSLTLAIWVGLLYLVVTNIEAHVLVPYIYGRAVRVHALLVVIVLLLGTSAFGIVGALAAVPFAAAVQAAVENLYVQEVVQPGEAPDRD